MGRKTIVYIDAVGGDDAETCVIFQNGIPFRQKIGRATEIQAKYTALIQALKMLEGNTSKQTVIYTDCNYMVKHLMQKGHMLKLKHISHQILNGTAKNLIRNINGCMIEYMPKSKLERYTT